VTPSVAFSITRNSGTSGLEYCAAVTSDGVHALVTVAAVSGADGTSLLRVTGYFAAPSDPAFGGAEIVALKPDGSYYVIQAGRLTPITNDVSQPASVESWTFYLRSIDINGRRNTIVGGVTPSIVLSVGNASGVLNLTKAASSSFSSEFQISSGAFRVNQLSAATIVTGNLQVGGGGSKVPQLKIFDTFSSLIGFIGDDTGGTGYVGAWFKQARVGGTSPSTAPLQADTSGNLSIAITGTTTVYIDGTNFVKVSSSVGSVQLAGNDINITDTTGGSSTLSATDLGMGATAVHGTATSGQIAMQIPGGALCRMTVDSGVPDGILVLGSTARVWIGSSPVLASRVATTPVTLADVIGVMQHHGLSN
jgi:hypothetical protein